MNVTNEDCPFFRVLRLEPRLRIYQYTIPSGTFTISSSAAPQHGTGKNKPVNECIPGLPESHEIAVSEGYNPKLMVPFEVTYHEPEPEGRLPPFRPPQARAEYRAKRTADKAAAIKAAAEKEDSRPGMPVTNDASIFRDNIASLHLTCRTIHADLADAHLESGGSLREQHKGNTRRLHLNLSFPAGVCIVANIFPHLLPLAGVVRVAGVHRFAREHEGDWENSPVRIMEEEHMAALKKLIEGLLDEKSEKKAHELEAKFAKMSVSPAPRSADGWYRLQTRLPILHLRIFHPHHYTCLEDAYRRIWHGSPTPLVLAQSTIRGAIRRCNIFRGSQGTGIEVKASGVIGERGSLRMDYPKVLKGCVWRKWLLDGWDESEDGE